MFLVFFIIKVLNMRNIVCFQHCEDDLIFYFKI